MYCAGVGKQMNALNAHILQYRELHIFVHYLEIPSADWHQRYPNHDHEAHKWPPCLQGLSDCNTMPLDKFQGHVQLPLTVTTVQHNIVRIARMFHGVASIQQGAYRRPQRILKLALIMKSNRNIL